MFTGKARIEYSTRSRIVGWIDQGIADYYFSLIPKAVYAMKQLHPPHITIVRSFPIEVIPDRTAWGRHEGRVISFEYNGIIRFREPYFYLDVWSADACEIRKELGLEPFRAPFDRFHFSIGNIKSDKA